MSNGILVCRYHHEHIHRRGIEIHRRGNRWVFTDRDGRELADTQRDRSAAA